jgi:hydrogenase expression/formation protein HypE
VFGLDPLATIASGALLMAVPDGANGENAAAIRSALEAEGIRCAEIGRVEEGPAEVVKPDGQVLARPIRDEIARVYDGNA